ncbi:hypothetical protein KFL_005410080 [Klebsormidium nitens]|uniref:CRIB domain-containing protein n=1 Tax=Klebsormidium nitens TaxID=105231 RepID=A0A1Y1IJI2_KLENI|nr:hypothetical protein KFL_005410080 [Klebsormidium nitens]|eukprot:GAQ89609.1 hypothetical protein KFL_005410080 [Klebsormidium nitens]
MWTFYVVAIITVVVMDLVTLFHYASPKADWMVKTVVAYAWFTNLSIVILVPIDVYTTLHHGRSNAVSIMWSTAYWSAQALTWLIIPTFQHYEDAGDFTVASRLKYSVRHNVTFYGSVGAVGLVGLVLLIASGKMTLSGIQGYAIAASNTFGLVTGGLLLAYGLVELPRGLWRHADLNLRQRWLAHKVGRIAEKLDEAHGELSTAIVIAQATSNQMSRRDPLRPYMDMIDTMAAEDPTFKPTGGRIGENDMDYDMSIKTLASLRKRLRNAKEQYYRYKSEYAAIVWAALELEDTMKNAASGKANDYKFVSTIRPTRTGQFADLINRAEWLWRCVLRSVTVQLMAALLIMVSLALIFAEATIITDGKPDLSVFSLLIKSAGDNESLVQIFTFVPLVYICVCTYFSVFKLGMFSFYYLVPKHTDAVSLLVNASLTCRFAAPMSYNFLHLIHVGNTVFDQKMGQMGNIPVLGDEFNTYFPFLMVAFSSMIAANVFNRFLDLFGGSKRFHFDDEDRSDDFTASGNIILRKERASLERGMTVGESVMPLARSMANGDVEAGTAAPASKSPPRKKSASKSISPSPSTSLLQNPTLTPPRDTQNPRRYVPPSQRPEGGPGRPGSRGNSRPTSPGGNGRPPLPGRPNASPAREMQDVVGGPAGALGASMASRWGNFKGSLTKGIDQMGSGLSTVAEKLRASRERMQGKLPETQQQAQPLTTSARPASPAATLDNIFAGLGARTTVEDEEDDVNLLDKSKPRSGW